MDEHIISILVKEALDKEIGLKIHEIHMRIDILEDKVDKIINEKSDNK